MKLQIPDHFETSRLNMVRLRHEDAEEIFYTYASKPEATKFVSWKTHDRLADTRAYLENTIRGWNAGAEYGFAVRLRNNRLIGSCGILNDGGKVQFGYILSPSQWGKGYATEVCMKLMEVLQSIPGVVSIWTFIDSENEASARVLLKAGLVVADRREGWFSFVNQLRKSKNCILFTLPLPPP